MNVPPKRVAEILERPTPRDQMAIQAIRELLQEVGYWRSLTDAQAVEIEDLKEELQTFKGWIP